MPAALVKRGLRATHRQNAHFTRVSEQACPKPLLGTGLRGSSSGNLIRQGIAGRQP